MGRFLGPATQTGTSTDAYTEALVIDKGTVKTIVIYIANTGDTNDLEYKICGRNFNPTDDDKDDDTYDFDISKDEGTDDEATEFTLAQSSATREVVEEPWQRIIVKVKNAEDAEDTTTYLIRAAGE